MAYNLIIYEDNERLRHSMEIILNDGLQFNLIASYANAIQIQSNLATHQPHVILMDIDMPQVSGIQAVEMVKQFNVDIKVLMFTVYDDDDRIFEAICNGADGYMLKNTSPNQLVQSLVNMMDGDCPMSPQVAQKVFHHFKTANQPNQQYHLTPREKEILQFLVKGNSYKMIAANFLISIDTVKRHLQNIYAKLHVSCGTEAVAKAIQQRIVKL